MQSRFFRHKIRVILFLFYFISVSSSAFAVTLPTRGFEQIEISENLDYFVESSAHLTIEQARELFAKGEFKQGKEEHGSFGFLQKPLWVTFELANFGGAPVSYLLEFYFPPLEQLELYEPQAKKTDQAQLAGALYPEAIAEFKADGYLFPINLQASQTKRYFIRVETNTSYILKPVVWERNSFFQKESNNQVLWGIFVGVTFFASVFFTLLYWATRDSTYIYFILYHLAGAAFLVSAKRLVPDPEHFINQVAIYSPSFAMGFALLFAKRLLFSHIKSRSIDWAYGIVLTFGVMTFIIALFLERVPAVKLSLVNLGVGVVFFVAMFIVAVIKKSPYVWVFFVATMGQTVLRILQPVLSVLGIKFGFGFSFAFLQMGAVYEYIIYTLALSYTVYQLRVEKTHANEKLLVIAQEHAKDLTKKIEQATEELEKSNEVKDKFFSLLAHDLKGPLGSISAVFNKVLLTEKELTADLLQSLKTTTNGLYESMVDLLDWARSQMGHMTFTPDNCNLSDAALNATDLLSNQIEEKKLTLTLAVPKDLWVFADTESIVAVIRNLCSNAIKFSGSGSEITLQGEEVETGILFRCVDKGIGIAPSLVGHIFQLDSELRNSIRSIEGQGTGLGLILCHEFIAKNGGKIGVESTVDEGSEFWFILPKGQATS